jgi:hypothetical protein
LPGVNYLRAKFSGVIDPNYFMNFFLIANHCYFYFLLSENVSAKALAIGFSSVARIF